MDFLSSNSQYMMENIMRSLWTRQATTLDNIANAETPNYKPKYVTFEDTLRMRLESTVNASKPRAAARAVLDRTGASVLQSDEVTRMDGNGVNVAQESLELVRTGYQLQYLMQSISTDLATLRSAIRGQ